MVISFEYIVLDSENTESNTIQMILEKGYYSLN